LVLAASLLLVEGGPAFAQVFKWVDERGVTHYGERPPQGVKASEVRDKLASPPSGGPGAAPPPPQAAGQGESSGQAPKAAPQTPEERRAAARDMQCNQQRAILARLKESPPSFTLNEKGEKVPYDNSQVIAQQEKRVAEQCKG
jgi:hypothetical protein